MLKKAQKKLISQKQAGAELGLTGRHVRRLVKQLEARGEKAVIHALRGKPSNRKLSEPMREKILAILSQAHYRDFGPTAASAELASKHDIRIGREALRQLLIAAGRWRAQKQWRQRWSCRGGLVQRGHQRARLAGGARRQAVSDRDDRRCQQRVNRPVCHTRFP